MARPRRKKTTKHKAKPAAPSTLSPETFGRWLSPTTILIGITVLIAVCYLPLLRYFFAQDDFMLLNASAYHLGEELARTFGAVPHHFRPLTEFLYFAGAYKVFGLNATPYHIVSLLIHLCNTWLVYLLLRRLRVSSASALVATALFGLSVAWFHVVGWITCIQQLVPQSFALLCLLFAVDALRDGSASRWALSIAAYLLALFSYEQQVLLPLSILLIAVFGLAGEGVSVRDSAKKLWPYFAVLAIYLAVRLFWKGMPGEGRSEFVYGLNIIDNLMTYLGGMTDFWPAVTGLITYESYELRLTHIFLGGLIVYQRQKGRWREVVFGVVFMVTMILPALFLVRHYYYYHTYAASFGAIYLLALTFDDGFEWLERRFRLGAPQLRLTIAAALVVAIAGLSFWKVRANERLLDTGEYPNYSFVLKRATLARKAYDGLMAKAGNMEGVREVQLLYGNPSEITDDGFVPFMWALAHGDAVNIFFDEPDLDVSMEPRVGTDPNVFETPERRLFYYDQSGNIYTAAEVLGARKVEAAPAE
jgi:hypothetical protein